MPPIRTVVGVRPRVVGRRLTRAEQAKGNNAIAERKAKRLAKKLAGDGKKRVGLVIVEDPPELLQTIREARRSLAAQPWWEQADEAMQEGLLLALEAFHRGTLSQAEWRQCVTDAQAVLRGPVQPAAIYYRQQYRNIDMFRLPGGW